MACYRNGGCGPYENHSCNECPASKPEYQQRMNKPARYVLYDPNDNQKYVVIYNHSAEISSIRHIVVLHDEYDEEDFKKWYYGSYQQIEGDQFHLCTSTKDMHNYVDYINKKRAQIENEKAQAARKKCKFCGHGNCIILHDRPGISVQCNLGSVIGRMPKIMKEDDVCEAWKDEEEDED